MIKRIVIMAGGTGGHVFPALAVALNLREKNWQVTWLGTKKGLESRIVPANGIDVDWLSVSGFRGKGLMTKLLAVIGLGRACIQALQILRTRNPDVVLGMGGFVAGPGGLMAKLLRIPLVIHEQNRIPGTTNRLLAKFADRLLEAFPNSFPPTAKAVCTGNPLRKDFLDALGHQRKAPGSAINILIFGGSQGAQALNETVPDAMALLSSVNIRHQTGEAMRNQVANRYQELSVNAEVQAFIEDMVSAYQWADIVICRSGAMTISEIAAMGVPAIFVPLPNAIDDHQVANARFICENGGGLILLQKELTAKTLAAAVNQVCESWLSMAQAAKQCARPEATELVAEYCLAEAGA